jgi:hypothetical protein
MAIEVAEFNTIITMLGMLCATVQGLTGYYAAYHKKKMGLIRANDTLFRSHRAFGSAATTLYLLGLFMGTTGFINSVRFNNPPFLLFDPLFTIHSFGGFIVVGIVLLKIYLSYFNKGLLYAKTKGKLGAATFLAWAFTWVTSCVVYYNRTLPPLLRHSPPTYLLPVEFLGVMLLIPFLVGGVIGVLLLRRAEKMERAKT